MDPMGSVVLLDTSMTLKIGKAKSQLNKAAIPKTSGDAFWIPLEVSPNSLGLSNQLWEAKTPFITFEANDMRWVKSSWAKPVLSSFPPGNKSTASCQSPCASLAEINVQKWIALVSIPRQRVLEISAVNMVGLKQSNYDLTNQNVGFSQSKKGTFA